MPTDVRCLVETDDLHTLVRLVGVLDLPAAASVRSALLTCLADQPAPVVVDVSELVVVEPDALAVVADAAREAAEWPAGRPVVWAPPPHQAQVWQKSDVAVLASLAEAFATIRADEAAGRRLSTELAPAVSAAREARDLVHAGCRRWDLAELSDSACITVTELVNNAVAHARTPMTVRLALRDQALHLAVRDYSVQKPMFEGPASPTSPGGRGLLLIDNVARRWGTSELDDGKVVWAVLYPEDGPDGPDGGGPGGPDGGGPGGPDGGGPGGPDGGGPGGHWDKQATRLRTGGSG